MPTTQPRRHFLKNTALGLPLLVSLPFTEAEPSEREPAKLKIVCVGGHPDDPESGCGGTLILLARAGHEVSILYLTTGEAGIEGKTHAEAAAIRKQEAIDACAVIGAKPVFAGQIDGATIADNEWMQTMQRLIEAEKPDIVFTHWPMDAHKDHQIASMLTQQVWMRMQHPFALYFYEACPGEQTMCFRPTDYMDITAVQELKRKAVFCHLSQAPQDIYNCGHTDSERFRGREMGVKAAEGFVRMVGRGLGGM
jgi:LmbE family N-acetylglucosaminyl deacetylase